MHVEINIFNVYTVNSHTKLKSRMSRKKGCKCTLQYWMLKSCISTLYVAFNTYNVENGGGM